MTSLLNDRFVFLDDVDHHLYIEEAEAFAAVKASRAALSNASFSLLYGGVVDAFAFNPSQSMIAMVCPFSTAVSDTQQLDGPLVAVLRLYRFVKGDILDMLSEMALPYTADEIVWIDDSFLALSIPAEKLEWISEVETQEDEEEAPMTGSGKGGRRRNPGTVLVQCSKPHHRLSIIPPQNATAPHGCTGQGSIRDGAFPVAVDQQLGMLDVASQTLFLWDVQSTKRAGKFEFQQQPSRRGRGRRRGKADPSVTRSVRSIAGTSSSDAFVILVNNDWTMYGLSVSRRSVQKFDNIISQFGSRPGFALTRGADNSTAAAGAVAEEAGVAEATVKDDPPKRDTLATCDDRNADGSPEYAVTGDAPPPRDTPAASCIAPSPVRLLTQAMSPTRVLVSIIGSHEVLLLESCLKERVLRAEAKMRLDKKAGEEVVALSKSRCLIRRAGATVGASGGAAAVEKRPVYEAVILDLKKLGSDRGTAGKETAATEAIRRTELDRGSGGEGNGTAAPVPLDEKGGKPAKAAGKNSRRAKKAALNAEKGPSDRWSIVNRFFSAITHRTRSALQSSKSSAVKLPLRSLLACPLPSLTGEMVGAVGGTVLGICIGLYAMKKYRLL